MRPFKFLRISLVSIAFAILVFGAFSFFVKSNTQSRMEALVKAEEYLFASGWDGAGYFLAQQAFAAASFMELYDQENPFLRGMLQMSVKDIEGKEKLQAFLTSLNITCLREAKERANMGAFFELSCGKVLFSHEATVVKETMVFGMEVNALFAKLNEHDRASYGILFLPSAFPSSTYAQHQVEGFEVVGDEGLVALLVQYLGPREWQGVRTALAQGYATSIVVQGGHAKVVLFLPLFHPWSHEAMGYLVKIKPLGFAAQAEAYLFKNYLLGATLLFVMLMFGYMMWRKKSELEELNELLGRQQEEAEAIIRYAGFGFAILDLKGNITRANKKLADFFGVALEELAGSPLERFLGKQETEEALDKVTKEKKAQFRHRFMNQRQEPVDLDTLFSLRSRLKSIHYIAVSREEKSRLETLLAKLHLYFNHSDLGYVVVNEDFLVVDVNETIQKLFGFTQQEVLGKSMAVLFPTEQLFQTWRQNYTNVQMLTNATAIEYRLSRKEGASFWVEMFGNRFVEEGREYAIWSIRDISTRVNARNVIRKLNERLQKQFLELEAILDVIPMPIFIKDKRLRYKGCNGAFASLFGISKEALIGAEVGEFFESDFAAFVRQKDKNMATDDFQKYTATVFLRHLGQERIFEFYKKALYKEGEFDGFVGIASDITSKEYQKALLEEEVRLQVEKNIAVLRAHQDEKIKDAKFSSIGKMAAGITHEINTPLTYVKGNVELLQMDIANVQDTSLRASMQKDTEVILEGLERIANIIESMREASQKSNEEPESVNLFATLMHALILSHNRAKQVVRIEVNGEPFHLDMRKDDHVFTCKVQRQRIEQVWIIIISNALDELIKIEEFEKRQLCIRMFEKENQIVTVFKDNGGGIALEILDTLFDPFVSTKVSSGMGIGLNIAQRIVREQGGEIVAYNQGGGAVFEVRLPCMKEKQ